VQENCANIPIGLEKMMKKSTPVPFQIGQLHSSNNPKRAAQEACTADTS
jgi:hypothetical protein